MPKDERTRVQCLPLPARPFAALKLLLQLSMPFPVPDEHEIARVRLHYLDGGDASLPIRTQREVPGFSGRDQDVVSVLAVDAAAAVLGMDDPGMQVVTLANPQPGRIARCMDLESVEPLSPGILLAVTVAPVPAERGAGVATATAGAVATADGQR
jgi:hypothetical protein